MNVLLISVVDKLICAFNIYLLNAVYDQLSTKHVKFWNIYSPIFCTAYPMQCSEEPVVYSRDSENKARDTLDGPIIGYNCFFTYMLHTSEIT